MVALNVARVGKKWVCALAGVELYSGPSANEAQDLADALGPELKAGSRAKYTRLPADGDKKARWATCIGDVEIDNFGSSANKAVDLAEKINASLSGMASIDTTTASGTQVSEAGSQE